MVSDTCISVAWEIPLAGIMMAAGDHGTAALTEQELLVEWCLLWILKPFYNRV